MANVTQTISVRGMSCNHCTDTIERSLGQLNGVQSVKVDLARALVTVSFDDKVISVQNIHTEIDNLG